MRYDSLLMMSISPVSTVIFPKSETAMLSTQRPPFGHHFRNLVIGGFELEGDLSLNSAPSKMTK